MAIATVHKFLRWRHLSTYCLRFSGQPVFKQSKSQTDGFTQTPSVHCVTDATTQDNIIYYSKQSDFNNISVILLQYCDRDTELSGVSPSQEYSYCGLPFCKFYISYCGLSSQEYSYCGLHLKNIRTVCSFNISTVLMSPRHRAQWRICISRVFILFRKCAVCKAQFIW